jgi:hypothetical protein
MTGRTLKKAAAFALLAAFAAMLAPATATAGSVSYYTTGVFSTTGTTTISGGGSSITYTAAGSSGSPVTIATDVVSTTPGLGYFSVTSGTPGVTVSGTLTLDIYQTAPGNASGAFVGALSGKVAFNGTTGQVTFNPSTTLLLPSPPGYIFEVGTPVQLNAGTDNIQVLVTVPEPASMAMCGTALLAVTGVVLRRRKLQA